MNQKMKLGLSAAILALGVNQQALAHVTYTNITNAGTFLETGLTTYGWNQGQIQPSANPPAQGALASTDDVNWYSFTLSQASDITLSISTVGIASSLNPLTSIGFSLYSNTFVSQSYDITPVPGLTTGPGERGLVNTAASFTLTTASANVAYDISNERTISFITSQTGTDTAALVNYLLGPGTYSVIAGGNDAYSLTQDGLANYTANVSFSATAAPVPVPAAFWLMGSVLAGLRLFGGRKNTLTA